MKMTDKHELTELGITIGRRINIRTNAQGQRVEQVSRNYTAEYSDADGKRRIESLQTPNKREAIRRAQQIHHQLTEGEVPKRRPIKLTMISLVDRYIDYCKAKGISKRSVARYSTALSKLLEYCQETEIKYVSQLNEEKFFQYTAWLRGKTHKQRAQYSSKSIHTECVICKQMLNFAYRQSLIRINPLAGVKVPKGRSKEAPCFTTSQIHGLLGRCRELMQTDSSYRLTHDAIAILAFSGLRVGELRALRFADLMPDRGEHGMIRVCRGGSQDAPKSKHTRYVPILPVLRPIIDAIPQGDKGDNGLVMPDLRERSLLARVKDLARTLEYGSSFRTHSLRHHYVSMCASAGVPQRLVLSWVGHHSSELISIYFTLHDEESDRAVHKLADSTHGAQSQEPASEVVQRVRDTQRDR
tara:strand:+ start:70411 stop:71649 length:1239 start_codon:yes stop_codon:yes gene_type:complete